MYRSWRTAPAPREKKIRTPPWEQGFGSVISVMTGTPGPKQGVHGFIAHEPIWWYVRRMLSKKRTPISPDGGLLQWNPR